MAEIHWANPVDGSFTNASYWTGGVVPGSGDDAILDAAGPTPYTVTVSQAETVTSIQTAANATLDISGAMFQATAGTGSGANAGVIDVSGGSLELGGSVVNSGSMLIGGGSSQGSLTLASYASLTGGGAITLSGSKNNQLLSNGTVTNVDNTISGAGIFSASLTNDTAGIIDATGMENGLELEIAQGGGRAIHNYGLIESTGSAGMLIYGEERMTNAGTIEVNNANTLTILWSDINNNGGEIVATDGSTLGVYGIGGIGGGTVDIEAGATLNCSDPSLHGNGAFIYANTFENAGLISIPAYGFLVADGTLINTGTISLNASSQEARLSPEVEPLVLIGGGVVTLSDSSENVFDAVSGDAGLLNVNNTITGAGNIGDGDLGVDNEAEGVFDATGTDNVLEFDAVAGLTNTGLIESTGAAGMLIDGGTTYNNGTIAAIGSGALTIEQATIENDQDMTFGNGVVDVATGGTLVLDAASEISGGTLLVAGSLTSNGTIAGAGTLAIAGGAVTLDAGTSLAISSVTETGNGASATFETSNLVYAGVWSQTAGALSAASGDRVNFTGAGDSFTGTLAGAGTIAFIGGSDTLDGVHVTAFNPVINGATVTLNGVIGISGVMSVSTTDLVIAAGGASLGGGGDLVLSDLATNKVSGGTLTNVNDYIKGAGALGDGSMGLINDKGGIIDGDDSVALTIDTTSTITNAGTIEATSKGITTVVSAVDNTGLLAAFDGTLTVDGAVSGTGKVEINAGTAEFAGAFTQNVTFLGAGAATLELAQSEDYTGEISGFSRTGTTSLDLEDIAFVSGTTKASYSGTTTSGVLAVADGSHVAKITLEGNYTKSTFTLSSDGHGGTSIGDPAAASGAGRMASTHPFIAAMASLGASGGTAHEAADGWRGPMRPILAAPR